MMNKFWFLTKHSFMKKAKSKWFVIVNLLLLVGIVAIMNIDTIIKAFGGDFNEALEVVVVDNTNYSYDTFNKNLLDINKQLDMGFEFNVKKENNKSVEAVKEDIKGTSKVAIVLDRDENVYLKATIVSDNKIESTYYQILYQSLSQTKDIITLGLTNIDPTELAKITTPISVDRILISDEVGAEESTEMIMGTVFPTVILPFFILVIFLVQMIGAEINEEKQTRSMEVIISNVSPKTHFFSKMVASNGFVLMQGALLIIYALIAFFIRNNIAPSGAQSGFTSEISNIWNMVTTSGLMDKMWYVIPITLVLMVLSFIAYSLVAGILASMTVSMEDYQQIQTPIIMVSLVGYYLAIMAGMFTGSVLIRFFSYIPFISCLLAPALLVIGQIGVVDVMISIVVLVVFNFVLIKYGLKIYKIGILNYSTDKMWRKIFKAVKAKE